jgi:hypothetical protein
MRHALSPVGTFGNSPAIHCRERIPHIPRPVGTLEFERNQNPLESETFNYEMD